MVDETPGGYCPMCDETPCACPCLPGQHTWKSQQLGGPPDVEDSYEWVTYCTVCGYEPQDEED